MTRSTEDATAPTVVEVLEPFTFADGSVRLSWVKWEISNGERRAVSVRRESWEETACIERADDENRIYGGGKS